LKKTSGKLKVLNKLRNILRIFNLSEEEGPIMKGQSVQIVYGA